MNHLTGKSGTLKVVCSPDAGIGQTGRSDRGTIFGRSSSLGPIEKVVPTKSSLASPLQEMGLTSISNEPHHPTFQSTTPVDALIVPGEGTEASPGIAFVILHSRDP